MPTPSRLTDVALIVPTYRPGPLWAAWLKAWQMLDPAPAHTLVIDSNSGDGTAEAAEAAGCEVWRISPSEFNHGGTRQRAAEALSAYPILVYVTQDALFAHPEAIAELVACFADPHTQAAYGRQLPRPQADAIEAHARLFNYPPQSRIQRWEDRAALGIKAAFCSNSFAAYRRNALMAVGGFPDDIILSEDAAVAGRMVQQGGIVRYVASAQVIHSHGYSWREEFRRYFDIGAFHAMSPWLIDTFGRPEGEGGRFVRSEWRYLWQHAPQQLPAALIRTGLKYLGYRLGHHAPNLPAALRRRCSMHPRFWARHVALK